MSRQAIGSALLVAAALGAGCASTDLPIEPRPEEQRRVDRAARQGAEYRERGIASWYGAKFHGRRTASGERFDMNRPSAAHRLLPFGTTVRVRDLSSGREIVVRINDRGPFVKGRVIDLSRAAAEQLGILEAGVANVELSVLRWGNGARPIRSGSAPEVIEISDEREMPVTVQAGAFRHRHRADSLVRRLRDIEAGFVVRSSDGWHRVQLQVDSVRLARQMIARLAEIGIEAIVLGNG